MTFLGRIWARLRGKEGDPTIGTQIAVVGATAAVVEHETDDAAPDYGWSDDHLSGSSGSGGSRSGSGGGFDGGGGGGDGGGAG